MMVAADLMRRGYKIALPYGEDWDYDLIVCREEKLERVQVKYSCSNGAVIAVRARSASLTNGKVRAYKYYTSQTVDWLATYDPTTDRCYYVPAEELGDGMSRAPAPVQPHRATTSALECGREPTISTSEPVQLPFVPMGP